jgi:3-hydroxyisobutyrate dehydrogenase-like beta-hydroxyacid dehydrogenase
MATTRVGFIGLGRMGLPMSYRLLRAGFDLTVHNRSQGKVQEIARAGAHPARSSAEVTKVADIVLTCLPDIGTVEGVFLGEDGIVANARPGQVLVDHSTVGVRTSKACAAAAEKRGALFLDAPISGGTERAANGTLTIMVGGPEEAYQRALQAFQAMGTTIRHIGPAGTGTVVKLVNQLLVGVHQVAAAEAMLLGAKSGADPELVLEVVNSGWGQSFMLARNGPVMLDRNFEGVRTQIKTFLKDLVLIRELAQDLNTPTPAGDLAFRLFSEADEHGLSDKDGAAIVLPLEKQAGFEIKRASRAVP